MDVQSSSPVTNAGESPPSPAIRREGPETSANSRLPKRPLQSLRIEGHVIQKPPSPKKKALDPLRYMGDRPAFLAVFTVVARFDESPVEHQVDRTYKQFVGLHTRLQKTFPKSNLPKEIPTMRKKRYDNQYITQKTTEINEYVDQLLQFPEVRLCKILREFLEDSQLSDDSDDDDAIPCKALDGIPGTIVSVRAGQSFSLSLALQNAGDTASWQFTTKKHNIGFSATFNGQSVRVYSREESQAKPIKGSFKCTEPGTLTLDWDNTYTWSKKKVLIYWAEVEQTRPLSKSVDDPPGSPVVTDATPMIDARRSGFIAQSRNPSMYPRQIMNSSISLITKPFLGHRNDSSHIKSGSLIVERIVKFRGRHWYRKWFVLDSRKCVLRYYDSENAAKKGLSLATISLSSKNACLAITSQDEAAPTQYLFMVRARKRCWKICASSPIEYHEWEHAISTAILMSQLKRRSAKARKEGEELVDLEHLNALIEDQDGIAEDSDDDDDDDEDAKDEDDVFEEETEMDRSSRLQQPSTERFPRELTRSTASTDSEDSTLHMESSIRPSAIISEVVPQKKSFRTTPMARSILLVLGLNAFLLSIRTSPLVVVTLTLVVLSGLLLVQAIENAPSSAQRSRISNTKDKRV